MKWEDPELCKLEVLWEGHLTEEEFERCKPGPGDRYILQNVRRLIVNRKEKP